MTNPMTIPVAQLVRSAVRVAQPLRLVTAGAVVLCAAFAADAAAHFIEAGLLPDSPKAAAPVLTAKADVPAPAPRHSKDGRALAERNIFCADCAPLTDAQPGTANLTSLLLVATNVSNDPARSFASIANLASGTQGGYRLGDAIPRVGTIAAIHYRYVDISLIGGQLERLQLDAGAPPVAPPTPGPAETTPVVAQDEISQQIADGTRKIDDTHFEVSRALVDQILANPSAFIKRLRVIPSVKDGVTEGFKLYGLTPASLPAKLGLATGDLLQTINGLPLTSIENGLNAYGKLRDAQALELEVLRRGKPLTLQVSIR
jgi:type II secretion system protein C